MLLSPFPSPRQSLEKIIPAGKALRWIKDGVISPHLVQILQKSLKKNVCPSLSGSEFVFSDAQIEIINLEIILEMRFGKKSSGNPDLALSRSWRTHRECWEHLECLTGTEGIKKFQDKKNKFPTSCWEIDPGTGTFSVPRSLESSGHSCVPWKNSLDKAEDTGIKKSGKALPPTDFFCNFLIHLGEEKWFDRKFLSQFS